MDFNTRISAFFLRNNRLTALCFLILVLLGTVTTMLLKTTGFPSPDVKFASIQTVYLGASSETVASEVTAPIEAAIRDVEGVQSFTSTSANSISFLAVSIDEDADTNEVVNKLNSVLSNLSLPDGVEDPEVSIPSIGGPDILYSLVSSDKEKLYDAYATIESKLLELSETAELTPLVSIEKRLLVTLDEAKMQSFGISSSDVQTKLATFGEALPVVSDVSIDGKSTSLLTAVDESSINDVKNLKFGEHRLRDFADVDLDYKYENGETSYLGLNVDGDGMVLPALHFQVKTVTNTDIAAYTETIEQIFEESGKVQLVDDYDFSQGFEKTLLVEDYSINNDNERQVEEVVTGLIGGELKTDEPWSHAGWLLGGVQLVFLVMLLFVSWRAAVVAAIAIPLSLIFSNIYIYAVGENLNTLVLFSLVLAIGLVVDPALVLLESVQRKLDIGLKGKEAALAAVKDVGMGLFLACLTSVIVFVPFGVVSGILGQIITYIPLTIIPAVVGSYVVPLVFLAWMGGAFLKAKRNRSSDEEENLWGIAKAVVAINGWILTHSKFLRFIIVVLALVAPIWVAGYYVQSGQVKTVQFASSENADYLQLGFVHFSDTTAEDREALEKKVIRVVADNDAVLAVFPFMQGTYMATLKPADERGTYLSVDVADDINAQFEQTLSDEFFDLKIAVISNGPPTADYQVTIALKSQDLSLLAQDAPVLAATIDDLCVLDGVYSIDSTCDGERIVTKLDDGYEGKESTVIEVMLDREKLEQFNLAIPGAPLTAYVNSVLRSLYSVNSETSIGSIDVDGETLAIILNQEVEDPDSLKEIKDVVVFAQGETVIKLSDLAEIKEKENPGNITRVNGETVAVVKARLSEDYSDEGSAALATQAVLDYYEEHPFKDDVEVEQYSEGDTAGFIKSFEELFAALLLAIVITYTVLVVFFESFTQPLVILYTIPLTFLGVFPGLAYFAGGQFGFLEIIGLIILVGIVENVAIFLIDAAKQKIREGWDDVRAISYASGIRFRAVILTKLTALASLAPLAVLSEQYRSLAVVIMAGLLTSGVTSLFTTPILFIFFRWLSKKIHRTA